MSNQDPSKLAQEYERLLGRAQELYALATAGPGMKDVALAKVPNAGSTYWPNTLARLHEAIVEPPPARPNKQRNAKLQSVVSQFESYTA